MTKSWSKHFAKSFDALTVASVSIHVDGKYEVIYNISEGFLFCNFYYFVK